MIAAHETPAGMAVLTALLQLPGAELGSVAKAAGLDAESAARTVGALVLAGDVAVERGGRFRMTESGLGRFEEQVERIAHVLGEPHGAGPLEHCPTFPLPMQTTWQEAICWNWRVEPRRLREHVPECLDLDLAHGRAWVSVTMSRLEDMRPSYLPAGSGWNFYQISHRAHVRYRDYRGEERRGCYFVRSYTNSPLMGAIGNALPEFKFHEFRDADMTMIRDGGTLLASVEPKGSDPGKVVSVLDESNAEARLPSTSLFRDLDEAYPFLVEVYDAYGWDARDAALYILTIERGRWDLVAPRVVSVYDGTFSEGLFDDASAELDSVFAIHGVPYRWKPLRRERRSAGT
jgi:uncharacterized protein YqjF (DUF2071 family)